MTQYCKFCSQTLAKGTKKQRLEHIKRCENISLKRRAIREWSILKQKLREE
jgi:hypothetical protein